MIISGSAFKILTGKSTGKRPLEKPRCGCEDNIRKDLIEIYASTGNWIDSTQDKNFWTALVNATSILRVP